MEAEERVEVTAADEAASAHFAKVLNVILAEGGFGIVRAQPEFANKYFARHRTTAVAEARRAALEEVRQQVDAVRMTAERMSCEAQSHSLTDEGTSLRAKLRGLAADLFKAGFALESALTPPADEAR